MHFNCKEMKTVKEGLAGFTDGGGKKYRGRRGAKEVPGLRGD